MLTLTAAEISDALLKPIKIKPLIDALVSLQTANVISNTVGANVVNTIFNDIVTSSTPVINQINILASDLRDHSEVLFGATDEINDEIMSSVSNPTDMAARRLDLSNLYDSIRDGYAESTTASSNITTLTNEFFSTTANYRVNYETAYSGTTYSTTVLQGYANQIVAANTLLATQETTLAALRTTYPNLSIEAKVKTATYLPNPFYVKLIPNTDLFYIYDDYNAKFDIGHKFPMGSLIVDPSANYTLHVLNTGAPTGSDDNIRRFMVMSGGDESTSPVHYINQGAVSGTIPGSDFKSLAFERIDNPGQVQSGNSVYTLLNSTLGLNGKFSVIDNA